MKLNFFCIIYVYLFSAALVYADSFHVGKMYTCILDNEQFEPVTFSIGINDAVSFAVKSDFLFLEGIEIEIKQSKANLHFTDTVKYSVYTSLTPLPSKNTMYYAGKKIASALLPNRSSHCIRIPVTDNHSFKKQPYMDLLSYDEALRVEPFIVSLNSVVKGLPPEFEKTVFKIIIRPLLLSEGALKINLHYPSAERKPVSVQINQTYLNDVSQLHFILPGRYMVAVNSGDYRNEMRTCVIERGKITRMDVYLQSLTPLLNVQVPENTIVIIDNEEIYHTSGSIPVSVGNHTIVFKMGSFELIRQIVVEEGKTYTISIITEVQFKENP